MINTTMNAMNNTGEASATEADISPVVILGIDHGFGNIKTAHTCFRAGVTACAREPTFRSNLLVYQGRCYIIGDEHKEFTPDKMRDDDYYLLTLAAIGRELKLRGLTSARVVLGVGLPLTWVGEQKEAFRSYLLRNDNVDFSFRDVDYHVTFVDAYVFPQGFSGVAAQLRAFKGANVLCDIGNGTMNILHIVGGHPLPNKCFTEKYGTNQCMLAAREVLLQKTGTPVDELIIEDVLRRGTSDMVEDKGTFYVFYDRLQLIQGRKMPSFIEDADCKLTLYRNCRNTENIATTSLRPISERKPKLFDNAVKGVPAKVHYCDDDAMMISELDSILNQYQSEEFKDVVILTVKTEKDSVLSGKVQDEKYRKKFTFSTCRKFKGLEADVVVLIDVDRDTFDDDHVLLFYVGTSRARTRLEILAEMTDEDCQMVLQERLNQEGRVKVPKRRLASALNANASIRKIQQQGE